MHPFFCLAFSERQQDIRNILQNPIHPRKSMSLNIHNKSHKTLNCRAQIILWILIFLHYCQNKSTNQWVGTVNHFDYQTCWSKTISSLAFLCFRKVVKIWHSGSDKDSIFNFKEPFTFNIWVGLTDKKKNSKKVVKNILIKA